MNSFYKIIKTSIDFYPCIVFSTSYMNPMDQKDEIEKDLREIGVKGRILFDLLLSHGNTPDRFFEAIFDGAKISEDSLKSIELLSEKIKGISSDFYHSQQDCIENSVLSKVEKFLIRKGLSLKCVQTKAE